MKIALLTDGITPYVTGGMEKHSHFLAKYLVLQGFEVDLYHCIYDRTINLPSKKEIDFLFFENKYSFNRIFSFYFPKTFYFPGHYLYNSFFYSKLLHKTILENNFSYDFIYSKGFTSWNLLRKKSNFKIATNFHGYEMYQTSPNSKYFFKKYLFRYLVKWIIKNSDYIISYGGKITEIINSLNSNYEKVIEIPAAIEKSWILKKINFVDDSSKRKILFVGRNEDRKGFKELMTAINSLSNINTNLEFHFIGPNLNSNSEISTELALNFHGLIKEDALKKEIFDQCDVLICPSYSEGMPNVILEAMSRGLAVIASDVGASSLLVDNENGILLNHISPSEILNSLLKINSISDMELNSKKLCSLKRIKAFSWEKVIEKLKSQILHPNNY